MVGLRSRRRGAAEAEQDLLIPSGDMDSGGDVLIPSGDMDGGGDKFIWTDS